MPSLAKAHFMAAPANTYWGYASCKRHYGAGSAQTRPHVRRCSCSCSADYPGPNASSGNANRMRITTPGTGLTTKPSCKDEARVGQQGSLTYLWAERGSRPAAPRDQRYEWAYIFGAVCPGRDTGAALVLPAANADAVNLHLQEISTRVTPGAHAVLVLEPDLEYLAIPATEPPRQP